MGFTEHLSKVCNNPLVNRSGTKAQTGYGFCLNSLGKLITESGIMHRFPDFQSGTSCTTACF